MADLAQRFRPFIYYCRLFEHRAGGVLEWDRAEQRSAYCLWQMLAGELFLHHDRHRWKLGENVVALSEPGTRVRLVPGVQVRLVVFDLVDRPRLHRQDAYCIDPDQPPQPGWTALFCQPFDPLLPEDAASRARYLAPALHDTYRLGAWDLLLANALLAQWVVELALAFEGLERTRRSVGVDAIDLALRTEEALRCRFQRPVEVAAVAAELGVTPKRLIGEYRRIRGCDPADYLRHLRVARAMHVMLRQPALPLAEVAGIVGFETRQALDRAFTVEASCPADRWRREHRQRGPPPRGRVGTGAYRS